MPTLAEKLLTPEVRPRLVDDCTRLIDEEVASKRGVSGLAIKAGFKTVKTFKKGIIPDVVNVLLDDFVTKLEPFYADHQARGDADIARSMNRERDRIAEALLSITDERAAKSRHTTLVKAYRKLRPQGHKQVVAAMPRLGAMLARYGL